MTLVSSLNIAREALAVNQAAITVVSNNIANVNTEGYSKLRLDQGTVNSAYNPHSDSAIIRANSLSGVTVQGVTRYSDSFLGSYYREQNSAYSYSSEYASVASKIENLTNELDSTGLTSALSDFYDAANSLSANPADKTLRANYVSKAQAVCAAFNSASTDLSNVRESLVGTLGNTDSSEISTDIDKVNDLFKQLADVNKSIVTTSSGGTPSSSLLDQRDSILADISSMMNITTTENKNGTMDVSVGGYSLVSGSDVVNKLQASNVSDTSTADATDFITKINIVSTASGAKIDITDKLTGGTIGAIMDVCGSSTSSDLTINGTIAKLNDMASSFASVMNKIQTQTDANGTPMYIDKDTLQLSANTPESMFVNSSTSTSAVPDAANITAANISINVNIVNDPYKVAAAKVTNTTDLTATGNNSNIKEVLAARTNSSYYAGTEINGSTLEDNLSTFVADVGNKVSTINSTLKTNTSVLNEVKTNLSSVTGVNLDEELADMLKYQQAYQAAARIFSICNDVMEALVNLGK